MAIYGVLLSCLVFVPSCYLKLLDRPQKLMYRTVGPSLATSLEPLVHHQNVARLSLFYRYYFGRCLCESAELVPLPYSRGSSTHYSDRLRHETRLIFSEKIIAVKVIE